MDWLKLFEIIWAWPTVAAAALLLFHKEVRVVLQKVAASTKAKLGSFELEMTAATPNQPAVNLQRVENVDPVSGSHLIDGKEYINCRFDNAVLRFAGEKPVSFIGCRF